MIEQAGVSLHPTFAKRVEAVRQRAAPGGTAVSAEAWQAIRAMCR
jgi:hypothetical protein